MKYLPMDFKKRRFYSILIALIALSFLVFTSTLDIPSAKADEADEIQKEIDKKKGELAAVIEKANKINDELKKLSGDLSLSNGKLNSVRAQIKDLQADIVNVSNKLEIKKKDLEERNKIKDLLLRSIYISEKNNSLTKMLITQKSISDAAQKTNYYLSFINTSNNIIGQISNSIDSYEKDKAEIEKIKAGVEKQENDLKVLVQKLASQVASSKNDLASTSQEQNDIQRKLNELSAEQKKLLEQKAGSFETSVGDVPSTGDSNSNPNYNPGFKPAFAAFSFGAPHRQGMSQYGAKGRAEEGQDYKEILKAYYGDVEIKEIDGIIETIKTDKGGMEFEGKYLKGLAEMPSSWHKEALKAQAVAARTYALARIGWRVSNPNSGSTICTTETCQVWSSSKASSSSAANWHKAVEDTKHLVLVSKKTGEIFSPLYAATSGGYNYSYTSLGHTTSGGWDTKCGSKNCWTDDAFESIGRSPWFYKGWYKTRSNQSCSRTHPWLNEEEFADIIGAVVLYEKDSDNQKHLSQVDAQKCWGKDINDTWSRDKVKQESGITSVKDISVSYSSNGQTSQVKVNTNKGEHNFSGEDFKAIFNLRAPGAIQIKSSLFNIENK
jgi:peptidoglycan hydrolase-like amidase/uncharacterized protein YoxC